MSRLTRYATYVLTALAVGACASSITEPTPAAKCTAAPSASAVNAPTQSCASFDFINPKI